MNNAKHAARRFILRLRATDQMMFRDLKSGTKSVETRAATVRYARVAKGDELVFACGSLRVTKRVRRVEKFKSIKAMFKKVSYKKIMPRAESAAAAEKVWAKFPGYKEKIRESGIIAMWLE